jgi:hypothetical protein
MKPAAAAAVAGVLLATISGCESSQDRSARLERQGAHALSREKGLVVNTVNADIGIVQTGVVTDQNGTAAVVVLRNRKPTPLAQVPIAIDVLGTGGKSVFKNNSPGLETSLVSVPALPPRDEVVWVDDQINPSAKPATVKAQIGAGGTGAPAALPRIEVGAPTFTNDPVSGLEASGKITNRSSITQVRLFVFVAAWRGKKLVAAGRGAIQRLTAGAHTTYHVFLIGNPNGARLTAVAPPTVLR